MGLRRAKKAGSQVLAARAAHRKLLLKVRAVLPWQDTCKAV